MTITFTLVSTALEVAAMYGLITLVLRIADLL